MWGIAREGSIRAFRGFMFVELLVVVVLIGLLAAFVGPVAGKWIRRSEDLAACAAVRQVLAVARLEAVKRAANVVVEVSQTADGRIRLRTFQDRTNDTTTPLPAAEAAAAGNCVQDTFGSPATDEPALRDVSLSPKIHFWKQGGSEDSVADGIRFDTYSGNCSTAPPNRIVFLPGGGIMPPEDAGSGAVTTTGGRGIYFADWQGKNYFRVTVESDLSGKGRLDKYVDGPGYVPAGWTWK